MLYYKKINLKFLDVLKNYLINNVDMKIGTSIVTLPEHILKIVNNELNLYGIGDISYGRYYNRPINSTQFIHVDGTPDLFLHCAINIPIEGGVDSKFIWYKGEFELIPVDLKDSNQKAFDIKWNSTPGIAESVEMIDGCYLVRIDQPHQAVASTTSNRSVFTIRFKGNPSFEEIYDLLQITE